MNLLLIGSNIDDIGRDIYHIYPKATLIKMDKPFITKEVKEFIKDTKVIMLVEAEIVMSYEINEIIDFSEKFNFAVSIVADKLDSNEDVIYSALEERIERVMLWYKNPENEGYGEFTIYSAVNLSLDDKVIRTPKKGKATTSRKQ